MTDFTKVDKVSANVNKFFEDMRPITKSMVTQKVLIEPSPLLVTLAKAISSEVERLTPMRQEVPSSENIYKYIITLIWLRVIRASQEQNEAYRQYVRLLRTLCIPSLVYQLLVQIGEAVDRTYGIRFIPAIHVSSEELLSPSEMEEVSNHLLSLRSVGLHSVDGTPSDIEGSLEFMAMYNLEGMITSYREDHPVYAFYRAFVRDQVMSSVTQTMSRITYGSEEEFSVLIHQLLLQME